MIEQTIYEVLRDHAGLSALISGRVYHLVQPQNAPLPTAVISRVSTEPVNSASGHSGLDNVRLQIDCRASTLVLSDNVAIQVKAAIAAATGFKSLWDGELKMHEPEISTFRTMLEFSIWAHT